MAYNYNKLRGKIIEKFGTQAAFAKEMGLSERTLSLKLNNKIYFKQGEITKAARLLNFTDNEIAEYFFILKIQRN